MLEMSSSVKNVLQWFSRAACAPSIWSNVYWSTAEAKAPLKRSLSIHFSRTSQPPRFTPRRKGIEVLDVAVVVVDGLEELVEVASELDGGMIDLVCVGMEIEGTEIETEGIVTGVEDALRDVWILDSDLVGIFKEYVVWRVNKGTDVALAIVLFAIAVAFTGSAPFPVPFRWCPVGLAYPVPVPVVSPG
jgi:hypothetical protein